MQLYNLLLREVQPLSFLTPSTRVMAFANALRPGETLALVSWAGRKRFRTQRRWSSEPVNSETGRSLPPREYCFPDIADVRDPSVQLQLTTRTNIVFSKMSPSDWCYLMGAMPCLHRDVYATRATR